MFISGRSDKKVNFPINLSTKGIKENSEIRGPIIRNLCYERLIGFHSFGENETLKISFRINDILDSYTRSTFYKLYSVGLVGIFFPLY